MPTISLKNINFSYYTKKKKDEIKIFDDFSLTFEKGKTTVIMGSSGSGKTTLIRLICGLLEPKSGMVLFDDSNVSDIKPKDRNIAYVTENVTNYPHLSGFRNIAFPLVISGADSIEIRQRVFDAAKEAKIDQFLQFKPKQLSLGQNQRIAIARSIVKKADLYIFDEMCSGLNEEISIPLLRDVKDIIKRHNATAIFVTHYSKEAFLMADRLIILKEGKIIADGTSQEIINSTNQDVIDIIGIQNENRYY